MMHISKFNNKINLERCLRVTCIDGLSSFEELLAEEEEELQATFVQELQVHLPIRISGAGALSPPNQFIQFATEVSLCYTYHQKSGNFSQAIVSHWKITWKPDVCLCRPCRIYITQVGFV